MKLFMFATHLGMTRFIFALDEQKAVDLFTLELVVTAAEPSRFWCQEFPLSRVVEPHRARLREAFALQMEGIGVFQSDGSWRIYGVGERPEDDTPS
jgi:hypothetical protein